MRIVPLLALAALAGVAGAAAPLESSTMAETPRLALPRTVGAWTRPDAPKRIVAKTIFDYMDGAGELYLGYRFGSLDAYEYTSKDQDAILVELYWMESPDDAYGLLSGDWGGERAEVGATALYGAGLLRIWSGNLFARVMTYNETPASREAVYTIARAITAGRAASPVPALARALPASAGEGFQLKTDRTVFLRSHLVLNSAYFLSSENLLDLGPDCELVSASYSKAGSDANAKPVRLLLVRYPDAKAAEAALRHFVRVYLPEKTVQNERGYFRIEDGWMGLARTGRGIALAFESADEPAARTFVESGTHALNILEESHER